MSLSQTFRFEGDPALAGKAYHFVLDPLTPEQVRKAGELAFMRYKYKYMPKPAQLLEWALENEGHSESQLHAGAFSGLWELDRIDSNGYEFYRRRMQ